MQNPFVAKAVATAVAMLTCVTGRALDFATTWVAVERGTAVEAKPVAAGIFEWLGHPTGMIAYELFITTPAIFLGLHLARRVFRSDPASANAGRLLLFLVGVISMTVAMYNFRFLI